MYVLQEENCEARKEILALKAENDQLRMAAARGGGATWIDTGKVRREEDKNNYEDAPFMAAYPDVGLPTPRSSSDASSLRGNASSRPSTAGSRRSGASGLSLYDDLAPSRPGTASERIETGYLQMLREEAGLVVDNPNEEMEWQEGDEDAEIMDLIERNENSLAKIREDLVNANRELSEYEMRKTSSAEQSGALGVSGNNEKGSKGGSRQSNSNAAGIAGGVKGLNVRELLAMRKKQRPLA